MQIPFVGGAYTSRSTNVNAQTCINLFPSVDQQDAKVVLALYGTPGLQLFSTPASGSGLCVRKMIVSGLYAYAVVGNTVYRIDTFGVASSLGTITTSTGMVSMASNGVEILIVDGTVTGYLITLATGSMAAVSDTDFPPLRAVTFQDGYFIGVEVESGKFWISGLYDGDTWDALDFATAEGRPDNGVSILSNTHDLWIFGEESAEIYYNSGDTDFPFTRITGALIDVGVGAADTPTKIDGVIYWLSNKRRVCKNNGYQYQYVSTPDIDYQISIMPTVSDAVGFTYNADGHSFYVLAFPTANKTFVLDIGTGYWHEWQSYYSSNPAWGRHRANCAVLFNDSWIVGDYFNGLIYAVKMDVYTDNGNAIRRRRTAPAISKERLQLIFHNLEIEFEAGVGLSGGVQGEDPQAMLDWSDDGGHTWSNQHWTSMGLIGEYTRRALWRRLGKSRNRIFRVTISDPVKVVMLGAYAQIEETKG